MCDQCNYRQMLAQAELAVPKNRLFDKVEVRVDGFCKNCMR